MRKQLLIRMTAAMLAVGTVGTVGTVGACASNPRPRVGVEYVGRRPPADRVEVVPEAPGQGYAWVKGHWGWRRDDYEWIPGHWAMPDRGYREWAPGRWDHDRNGWFYVEGHWR